MAKEKQPAVIKQNKIRSKAINSFERHRLLDTYLQKQEGFYTIQRMYDKLVIVEGLNISIRTIYDDLNYMKSSEGYNAPIVNKRIEGESVYYYEDPDFSIMKTSISTKDQQMVKDVLELLGNFSNMKGFDAIENISAQLITSLEVNQEIKPVIEFDENTFLKGKEFIHPLFKYIKDKMVLKIGYKSFKSEALNVFLISPYFLKQFNSRWFLFGWNHELNQLQNLALDRIETLFTQNKITYQENTIDFQDYFDEIIGVTNHGEKAMEKIRLQFTPSRFPYIQTKPLHGSQKLIDATEGIIELNIKINPELISKILSFGPDIKVLGPAHLIHQVQEKVQQTLQQYH